MTEVKLTKMTKIIHTMIRVMNLEKSIRFYKTALDLNVADRYDFDDFTLVYLRSTENDYEIELTYNKDNSEAYTHGNGYGHIAVCVDNIIVTREELIKENCIPSDIKEFFREGQLMAKFFFLTDPDGYKIEFLERHGRYQ